MASLPYKSWIICVFSIVFQASAQNQRPLDTLLIKAESKGVALDVVVLKQKEIQRKQGALVFLVGSSESSTMKNYWDMVQFFLEDPFLKEDFAIMNFDKRGVGKSEGNWYLTDFALRAEDAKNVAVAVSQLEFIDPTKIFLVGHSQGGWITQIALSEYPEVFAGGISMAGPTFSVKDQIINDYWSHYKCQGIAPEKALRKAKRKANQDLFLVSLFGGKGRPKQLQVIKKYTPDSHLKNLKKPLLLLFAENDPLVSPQWCQDRLAHIFPQGKPDYLNVHVAPGQDHSFCWAEPCDTRKRRERRFSEDTQTVMKTWVMQQLSTKTP